MYQRRRNEGRPTEIIEGEKQFGAGCDKHIIIESYGRLTKPKDFDDKGKDIEMQNDNLNDTVKALVNIVSRNDRRK